MIDLYYHQDIEAEKNDKKFSFSIEQRSIGEDSPDCRIGDFGQNYWIRPRAALKKNWKGYKNETAMRRAVYLSLKGRGFQNLKWVDRI